MSGAVPPGTRPGAMPFWKRAFDISCCLVVLPFFAAVTLLISLVMKFTSPGPVFYSQSRVGHRQRRFLCYKFRTMIVGADSVAHRLHCEDLIHSNAPLVKLDSRSDSRIIPGGWLLRASGLDELPQLINVLRGEMSLVGPRPCLPYEAEQYQPWQTERFGAVPGLTGLWQVSGKNRTTFDEMLRLDIHYARNLSWWLDLKIILMTVPSMCLQIRDTYRARKAPNQRSMNPRVAI
jgi:lipopolysaccharide/colanic/teichoic acid biosynthesis glycosyltransferase